VQSFHKAGRRVMSLNRFHRVHEKRDFLESKSKLFLETNGNGTNGFPVSFLIFSGWQATSSFIGEEKVSETEALMSEIV
jgi:hypothetical protein